MVTLAPVYIAHVSNDVASNALDDRLLLSLSQLVSWATESGTPNRPLIDWVADQLTAFGARVRLVGGPTGRTNLLATFGPEATGGLMLSGHTDVVPAGAGWSSEPYTATIDGDHIVGRGTADMKGFIACVLTIVEEIDPAQLRRPLHLALSYDEEVGCIGVRELLTDIAAASTAGASQHRPALVVIGEPTMMRPRHAHLGKVALRATFTADAAHSSLSPFRPSAISAASRVISVIDSITRDHERHIERSDSGEATAQVTTNVGTISGGSALNVLSERCEIAFELRFSARFDADELMVPIWAAIDAERPRLAEVGGGVDVVEMSRYPALDTPTDLPLVRLVERIADRGASTPIGFGTEGGLFAAALDVPVVICGPGDIAVAHRPDEHVSREQLMACLGFLRGLVDAVCVSAASPAS